MLPLPAIDNLPRSQRAAARLPAALEALSSCQLCAHRCNVNRLSGPAGRCHASRHARVFQAQVEVTDERQVAPTFAIAMSGCDLRCDFCITARESWNSLAGRPMEIPAIANAAARSLVEGARSIMILGGEPTIHLPTVLSLVSALPENAMLVWKTNGHATAQARALLAGLFDLWIVDYKFGNDECAMRLAHVQNYNAVVQQNLEWSHANSALIVRHLVMPGHVHCCWEPVAAWLAKHMPDVRVNLRTGFWPAWKARRHPELVGTVTSKEASTAYDQARRLRLNLVD